MDTSENPENHRNEGFEDSHISKSRSYKFKLEQNNTTELLNRSLGWSTSRLPYGFLKCSLESPMGLQWGEMGGNYLGDVWDFLYCISGIFLSFYYSKMAK